MIGILPQARELQNAKRITKWPRYEHLTHLHTEPPTIKEVEKMFHKSINRTDELYALEDELKGCREHLLVMAV